MALEIWVCVLNGLLRPEPADQSLEQIINSGVFTQSGHTADPREIMVGGKYRPIRDAHKKATSIEMAQLVTPNY